MKTLGSPSSASSKHLRRKAAYVARRGDSQVAVYATPVKVRGCTYQSYTVSFYAQGKRQRRRFNDLPRARIEADRIAEQKAQGGLGAAALDARSRLAIEEALTFLARAEGNDQAHPARVAEIVREHAAARALLPSGVSLSDAARFYSERHPADMNSKTVAEAVEEFIADRRAAECSAIHLRDLGIRLGQFSAAFQMPLASVSAPLLQQWVYGLKHGRNGRPAASRTKANMLRSVVSLFNFARRMHFIPAELAVEVAEIPVPKKKPAPIGIYSPDEVRAILAAADDALRPALAIAAFAGLRLAEVSRLDWREVRLGERQIVVEADKAKTAARRIVPISENLAAWLAPHERSFGPVSPAMEEAAFVGNALGNRIERAAARARVRWQRNGFRHSYISYRVATLKDLPAVALESGNSPAVIISSYRALATEAEGKAWFAVFPPRAEGNVVPLQAASSGA